MTRPRKIPHAVLGLALTVWVWTAPAALGQADWAAQTRHIFPQIADGGGWGVLLMVTNVGDTPAECTLTPYGVGLDRFSDVGITPGVTGATFSVAPAELFPLPTRGFTGPPVPAATGGPGLRTGYATLECAQAVAAQILYQLKAGHGRTSGMATLFSAQPGTVFRGMLLQDLGPAARRLGLAVANDAPQAAECTLAVYDFLTQTRLGEYRFAIPAHANTARFVDQFIPGLPAQLFGSVRLECTEPVTAIALLFDHALFTTLPLAVLND